MRKCAICTVFHAFCRVTESSATLAIKKIKRTVAEQTVEVLLVNACVAGEVFAVDMAEETICLILVIHIITSCSVLK
jgi:hypothetical protein